MSTNKPTPPIRRHYDEQFKHDAVQRVCLTGKSVAEVSRELGINPNILSRWRREHLRNADQLGLAQSGIKPSELAEQLRQSQKENADLRMQRDILKKALSIFSQLPPEGGR